MSEPPGRNRLLDAAERLFAEQGIEATSARAINAAADLSPAALHYHFGNKEAVVQEVLRRRMQGINQSRTGMIERFLERANPSDMKGLAEIIILPLVDYAIDTDSPGHWYIRFLSRVYAEQRMVILDFLETEHAEGVQLFDSMIHSAVPNVSIEEVRRRRVVAGETIIHSIAHMSELLVDAPDRERRRDELVRSLVRFVAGGLAAEPD